MEDATLELEALTDDTDPPSAPFDEPTPAPSSQPRSMPPPLPPSASQIPPARAAADDAFTQRMIERLAAGDYVAALIAAEALLEFRPLDSDASDTAVIARGELRRLYIARLGSLEHVPRLLVPIEALLSHAWLDARAALLLGRIDGVASVRQIVEAAGGMHATEALRLLSELVLRRAVALSD